MSVLDQLQALSTAEDFFGFLGVDYEVRLVDVARLHILRRMGQYLQDGGLAGLPDDVARTACRAHLERAYDDFRTASPLDHRVFKVLRDAAAPTSTGERAFVPLSALAGPVAMPTKLSQSARREDEISGDGSISV